MNSTDELRKWACGFNTYNRNELQVLAIADRIDKEHQKALNECDNERFNALMDARDKGINAVLKEPEGFGLTALPKDADGIQWCIGDKDEDGSKVIAFNLVSDGWYVITDSGWSFQSEKHRHYHVPTVEDVLHQFLNECDSAICLGYDEVPHEVFVEYAEKLQLKEN